MTKDPSIAHGGIDQRVDVEEMEFVPPMRSSARNRPVLFCYSDHPAGNGGTNGQGEPGIEVKTLGNEVQRTESGIAEEGEIGVAEDNLHARRGRILEVFFEHSRNNDSTDNSTGPSVDAIVNYVEETLSRFAKYKQRYGEVGLCVRKNRDNIADTGKYISPNVAEHLLQSFHQKDDAGRGLVSTVVDYPPHVARKLEEFENQARELYGCDGKKRLVFDFNRSYFVRSSKIYEIFFPVLIGLQPFWGRVHRLTEPGCDWVVYVKDFRREL
ncbi:hypothetical protein HY772_00620 [Candidatus Woesearchaeota archaeon]|nr:hypothetical protein [Candidatus Woesearchaeota archaeon]